MHLFSPDRPRLANGLPQLLCPQICIVPSITVTPRERSWELSVFLPLGLGWGRKTFETLSIEEVGDILECWKDDPEKTAKMYFAWEPTKAEQPPPKAALSLEDLGL